MARSWWPSFLAALACCLLMAVPGRSVKFFLAQSNRRCLSDAANTGDLVVGSYSISPPSSRGTGVPAQDVVVTLTDPKGNLIYSKNDADEGKFTHTAKDEGLYFVCFSNGGLQQKTIQFDFHSGPEIKDYSDFSKKTDMEPMEAALKSLEQDVIFVRTELETWREREKELRRINDSTNKRVLWFAVFKVLVLVTLSMFQIAYLKSYFRSKKLID
eukprot:g23411.t1